MAPEWADSKRLPLFPEIRTPFTKQQAVRHSISAIAFRGWPNYIHPKGLQVPDKPRFEPDDKIRRSVQEA
jgi:hypothetical protein